MGKKSLQQSQERDLGLLLELPDELDTLIAERRFAQAVQLLQQGYIFIFEGHPCLLCSLVILCF